MSSHAKQSKESLLTAASEGDARKVKRLIEQGAKVNQRFGATKTTALHKAAAAGHKAVVKLLLEAKANVRFRDDSGATPLDKALDPSKLERAREAGTAEAKAREDVAKLLLEAGTKVREDFLPSSFCGLCEKSELGLVSMLLDKGYPLGCHSERNLLTPLHYAGTQEMVELLLDRGADIEAIDAEDSLVTPLLAAIHFGRVDTTWTLLDKGANYNARSITGWTALHWAVALRRDSGSDYIIPLLFEFGMEYPAAERARDLAMTDADGPSIFCLDSRMSNRTDCGHLLHDFMSIAPTRRFLRWQLDSPSTMKFIHDFWKEEDKEARRNPKDNTLRDFKLKDLREDGWERRKHLVCCYVKTREARRGGAAKKPKL